MPYKPNDVQVKILGVSGSPRKGVTDYLTQMALEEAAGPRCYHRVSAPAHEAH